MDLQLKGKVALVTGGTRGIGRGIAEKLASEGCRILTCARSADVLEETIKSWQQQGIEAQGLNLDITASDSAEQLVDAAVNAFGQLDIVVNNAGGNRRGAFETLSDADWQDLLNLNLTSHIRVSRAAVKQMQKQGNGSIIFISSIFGREAGGKGLSIYNTTKTAMISLSKIMAMELAGQGIRVNSVAPGSIRFPGGSWDRRCIEDPEGMAKFIDSNLPLGRFGSVDEVANVVAFLSSDCASLVTGTCLNVDGCQSHSLI